jgi:cobalt-zinc-cadmium efflux system outer membrane protein
MAQPAEKLSLDDAIQLALQRNPTVLAAQKAIDAADARILQAGRIPNLELTASWNETPFSFNILDADEQDIGLEQSFEFPGKRGNRIEIATHDKGIIELNLERTKRIVTSKVKKAYYALLLSQESVASIAFVLDLLKQFQRLVTDRYQAGTSTYLDVIRAKVEITRIGNELTEAKRNAELRRAELNLLLGNEGSTHLILTDSLRHVPLRPTLEEALSQLTQQSAVLSIVRRSVVRQQSVISLAQKSYLPDFSVGLFHQRRAEQPPFPTPQSLGRITSGLGVELGVSLPLWFSQAPKGEVEEAKANLDIAQIALDAVQRRVRTSIANTYNIVMVAEAQLKVFDTTLLHDVEDALKAGVTSYQNNQIDALNLVDIYRTYRTTKLEYNRAIFNYLVAIADLEAAMELVESNISME